MSIKSLQGRRTSYWSSIETTVLNCLVLRKSCFCVRILATDKQMDSIPVGSVQCLHQGSQSILYCGPTDHAQRTLLVEARSGNSPDLLIKNI